MTTANVLIVDDEESIQMIMDFNFKRAGFQTEILDNSEIAYERILSDPNRFDLVILDLMLPGMYGMEVCKRLREAQIAVPIIVVTAHDDEIDKILGLEMWADDYVTKPFSPRELVARAKAVLRRARGDIQSPKPTQAPIAFEANGMIRAGEIVLDETRHEVTIRGKKIDMTLKEFELLHLFMVNANRVLSRDQLLLKIWGRSSIAAESRVVDVHVSHLREKIEREPKSPLYLQTVRGLGYKFSIPNH